MLIIKILDRVISSWSDNKWQIGQERDGQERGD